MTSTTPSADKVFAAAYGEIGYHEGANNQNKYAGPVGVPNNDAWCTTFASWCFLTANLKSLCLMSDYSVDQYNWFTNRGRSSAYPAVGAVVWYGEGATNHTGIVYAYDADYIYTIEGNYNNEVNYHKRHRRQSDDDSIGEPYAYGYPAYSEGIITADPGQTVANSRYAATASVLGATVSTIPPNPNATTPPPVDPPPVATGPTAAQINDAVTAVSNAYNTLGNAVHNALSALGLNVDDILNQGKAAIVGKITALSVTTPPVTAPPSGGSGSTTPTVWVNSVALNDKTGVAFTRYTGGGTVASWIAGACAARGITDSSAVAAWTKGYQTAIARESSGDANACNRNDSNNVTPSGYSDVHDYGNGYPGGNLNGALTHYQCSRGCAQCIPQTFAANHCPGTSSQIYDPVANIAASIGYVVKTYGVSKDGHDLASKVQQFDPNRSPKGY